MGSNQHEGRRGARYMLLGIWIMLVGMILGLLAIAYHPDNALFIALGVVAILGGSFLGMVHMFRALLIAMRD